MVVNGRALTLEHNHHKGGTLRYIDVDWTNYRGPNHEELVYYITNGATFQGSPQVFKIGTSNNIARRYTAYRRTHKEFEPLLLAVELGGYPQEAFRHRQASDSRINTDWYWPTGPSVELIENLWSAGASDPYLSKLFHYREADYQ